MSTAPIYLDYNATTPVDAAVLDAMLPFLRGEFGNPSSAHGLGSRAHDAVEAARAEVATLIGAAPDEIVFTSGGTEASNIAIRGAVRFDDARPDVVTSTIEHPATEACCVFLEGEGRKVTRVAAETNGLIDPARVAAAIGSKTALVTIIHAQNEIGTIQPVAEIAAAARHQGALVHVDAAQSVGKIAVNVEELGADLLSIAGHKLYAPKGVGVLYIRRGISLPPLLLGAGQERGRRPGTENVPYIAGLGEACRIAGAMLEREANRLSGLSGDLFTALRARFRGSSWSVIRSGGCRIRSTCCSPAPRAARSWKNAGASWPRRVRRAMPTARNRRRFSPRSAFRATTRSARCACRSAAARQKKMRRMRRPISPRHGDPCWRRPR